MKVIVIDDCYGCPLYEEVVSREFCTEFDSPRSLDEEDVFERFPEWCPLDDYEGDAS